MTGVSYMIPFVAAGGILIALGFLFGGDEIVAKLYGGTYDGVTYENVAGNLPLGFPTGQSFDTLLSQAGFAGILFVLGKVAFFMLVPMLSGFIAFGIADRPGLVPGIVGGLLAGLVGAGFLGGLVSGFAAGGLAYYMTRLKVPKGVRGIMPVVVIPLVSTIVIGLFMIFVVGKPVAALTTALTDWLNGLAGASGIVLGAILGLMMAFDMGGPLNKIAYTFAAAGLTTAIASPITGPSPALQIMAAVMAAGMTPPLGMALATAVRKKLWTEAERENGLACWLLGCLVHHRGCDPVRRRSPAAGHPVVHGRLRGHRRDGHGLRQRAARPARRHLRPAAGQQPDPVRAGDRRRHGHHRWSGHRADEPGQGEDRRTRARGGRRRGRRCLIAFPPCAPPPGLRRCLSQSRLCVGTHPLDRLIRTSSRSVHP